ncbi:hypothetical protein RvY_02945 [Ramazzottius varieornatus]|uniref:Uncharacterized protein n=1 Tax=Ramazzottius varieornatus TaxID=947166 RepID=A0A1D1US44_RAMVA|nr:hypothetical protein RvY_02945 [Ramazzottius varieornatus]
MPDLEGIFDTLPQTVNELSTSASSQSRFHATVVLLGASRCGKSALCKKLVGESLPAGYRSTIGMELKQTTVALDKTTAQLTFLDISGRPDYHELLWPLISTADGVICVFDLTRANSLDYLQQLIQRLKKEPQMMLVGTRSDLQTRRQVSRSTASDFAKSFGIPYFEVSTKNDYAVKETLREMCRMLENSGKGVAARTERRTEGDKVQPTAPARTRKASLVTPKVENVKHSNAKNDEKDEDDES